MAEAPLIIITGPTGVGKSETAMAVARRLNGEIVSADAGQVYQGFDIGSAKPSANECELVRHHCISLWAPDQQSDAVLWQRAADAAIAEIRGRGKRPLIVGGTGLYLRALIHGVFAGPDPDPAIRQRLQEEFENLGGEPLHRRLQEIDPKSAQTIHPNDPVRLVRALEFFEQTGKRISEERERHHFQEQRYAYVQIALGRAREELYDRINRRVEAMLALGWEREARSLYEQWGGQVPAFQIIGYRHLRDLIEGRLAKEQLIEAIQQASRHYAKRQLTWLRGDSSVHWVEPAEGNEYLFSLLDKQP